MKLNDMQYKILDKAIYSIKADYDFTEKQNDKFHRYIDEMIYCYDCLNEDEEEDLEKLNKILYAFQNEFDGFYSAIDAEYAQNALFKIADELGIDL